MEEGEVFYGPTDWLGSCDPMTHYNYTLTHRLDWMTEDSYYTLTDDPELLTDTRIMLTVYDRSMTDDLQTGLTTGSRTISHTRFGSVYIGLCTNS
jgi:hypothetical protein